MVKHINPLAGIAGIASTYLSVNRSTNDGIAPRQSKTQPQGWAVGVATRVRRPARIRDSILDVFYDLFIDGMTPDPDDPTHLEYLWISHEQLLSACRERRVLSADRLEAQWIRDAILRLVEDGHLEDRDGYLFPPGAR